MSLSRRLHADLGARQVATIDLNAIEIDTAQGLFFTNGHGTNHPLAYNLHALDRAPRKSEVKVGFAQGFTYDRPERELYVFTPMSARPLPRPGLEG